ncbi:Vacuolar sorting protein 39 [Chlorella vulgaris]
MGDGGGDAADGKLIDAFTLVDVLVEKKVVCLEAWSSYLLIGLSDGTLLLCSQRPAPSTEADGEGTGTPLRWTVVQSLRDFGSGQVKQLQVAVERSMLFCLADDGVNAYVLPSLRLKGQAGRTRGATLFAWHSASDVLAVATKRKLVFYRYDGLEFVVQREVSLPDTPTSMRLAGGTTLYAGLARRQGGPGGGERGSSLQFLQPHKSCRIMEYVAVDVASGSLTPLFATKGPAASVVFVSPSEVLLAKDNSGVLYGSDGRPSRRSGSDSSGGAVTWTAAPAVLAISQPYALALTESGVEARLLQPLNAADLRQQLAVALPDAAATCTVAPTVAEDGSLFVARRGDGTIQQARIGLSWLLGTKTLLHHSLLLQSTYRLRHLLLCGKAKSLRPVCFVRQSQQLLQLGEHEEALAMAALIPPQQAQRRRRLEDRIHLAYGRLLFQRGHYEEAMAHFGMSGLAGPLQLLSLFPSLAPPPLLAAAAAEQAGPAAAAAAARREGNEEVHGSGDVAAAGEEEGMLEEGEEAAAEEGAASAAAEEPQGEAFEAAVQVLMPYLLSHRSRLAAAAASAAAPPLRNSTAMAVDAAAAAQADAAAEAAAAAAVVGQQRIEGSATGALLDTSLLLALLAMPDGGALLRFVQRPNCVDLEAGEAALKASGRYSELVALYQTKGRHAAALDLLRALSQSPEQLPAPAQGASAGKA